MQEQTIWKYISKKRSSESTGILFSVDFTGIF